MVSARFTGNGSSLATPLAVAAGATVALAVVDTSGAVRSVTWTIVGSSGSGATAPTLTPSGNPLGITASLVLANAADQSFLIECMVNGGIASDGTEDPDAKYRAIIGVNNVQGLLPFVVGEELERNRTHGTTELFNEILRRSGTGGGGGASTDYVTNDSDVVGITCSDALDTLQGEIDDLETEIGEIVTGSVDTVFGRSGPNVVAVSGDYTSTLVTNSSSVTGATVTAALNTLNTDIGNIETSLTGYVPTTRTLTTTAPLAGGGTLASDLTLSVAAASTGATGVIRLTNDLAGSGASPTVARINGTTVPAAGALTTGHVLQVNGASSATYAYIGNSNVASNAGIVATKLEAGGADHVLLGGATSNSWGHIVDAHIDPNAAIAPSKLATGSEDQFLRIVSGVPAWETVSLVPTTTSVVAGAGMTGGGALSGNVTLNVVAADGTIVVAADSVRVGTITDSNVTSGTLSVNRLVPGTANYVLYSNGSTAGWSQITNALVATGAAIVPSKLAAGTEGQYLRSTSGVPTWTTVSFASASTDIIAGNGLTGGGNIGGDVTLNVAAADGTIVVASDSIRVGTITNSNITNDTLAAAKITHGSANYVLSSTGSATAWGLITNSNVATNAAILPSKLASGSEDQFLRIVSGVPAWETVAVVTEARTVTAGSGLTGGGALSGNITLNVAAADGTIVVAADSIRVGTVSNSNVTDNTLAAAKVTAGTNGYALVSTGTATQWGQIANAGIASDAAIVATKLAVGSTNSVLWSSGVANSWSSSPTLTGLTLSSGAPSLQILTTGTSSTSLLLGTTGNSNDGSIAYSNTGRILTLRAGDTNAVALTSTDLSPSTELGTTLGAEARWSDAHVSHLDIVQAAADASLELQSGDSNGCYIHLGRTSNVNAGGIAYTHSNETMTFRAGDAWKLTLTSADLSPASSLGLTLGATQRWGAASFSTADITNYFQWDSVTVDPTNSVGHHRVFSREGALVAQNQVGSHWQISPADSYGTSNTSIRCSRTRTIYHSDGRAVTQYVALPELADKLAVGQSLTLMVKWSVNQRSGTIGSMSQECAQSLFLQRTATSTYSMGWVGVVNPTIIWRTSGSPTCITTTGIPTYTASVPTIAFIPSIAADATHLANFWYEIEVKGYAVGDTI